MTSVLQTRETALVTDVILNMFLLGVAKVELEVLMLFVFHAIHILIQLFCKWSP